MNSAAVHGFDARESSAAARQRAAEADQALSRLLPAFTARGVYTRNQYEVAVTLPGSSQSLVIQPQNQLDATLQLDVPLLDLSSYHRYRSASALSRAARTQTESTALDIKRNVARSYYQFLSASALVRSAQQSLKAAEANAAVVDTKRAAGTATELDQARASSNVERSRQDIADAELAVALSARSLETQSGLTPTSAESFPEDDLRAEAPLERWRASATNLPQDRAARELGVAAEQSKKAANTALLPTLSANAQERFTNATGFSGKTSAYTVQLVAQIRLDLNTVANADAQRSALELQRVREERTRRGLSDALFEAHQRVQAALAKSRAARAQALAAKKAAALAADRYGSGIATQLDVTQAEREAFLADASRIQADADLAFARVALRLAAGLSPAERTRP